jgi:hypothetical protein
MPPGRKHEQSGLTNTDVRNVRHSSTHLLVIKAQCLIMHRNNFAFLFLPRILRFICDKQDRERRIWHGVQWIFACANLHPSLILMISGLIADRDFVNCLESYSTAHSLQANLTHIEVNQQYFRKYWAHAVNHVLSFH